jgi:hypothetical protein
MYFDRIRTAKPRWGIIYITIAIILLFILKPHIKGFFRETRQAIAPQSHKAEIHKPSPPDSERYRLAKLCVIGITIAGVARVLSRKR